MKSANIRIIIAVILLFLIPGLLHTLGKSRRRFSEGQRVIYISRPEDAFSHWHGLNVRGRVLVYFDRHFSMFRVPHEAIVKASRTGSTVELSRQNFLFLATNLGMIRKIYHIVPETSWQNVTKRLSQEPWLSMREVFQDEDGRVVSILEIRKGGWLTGTDLSLPTWGI